MFRTVKLSAVFSYALLGLFTTGSNAHSPHQPYASYWFVKDLLRWDAKSDPHAPFNVSETPLAKRFAFAPTQRKPGLSTKPQIMTLVSAYPTSNHPSQGFRDSKQYVFPFWQSIDVFVMWGGSSHEGIIVAPTVPWIDAAHQNGVEVYGTVFFPPKQYGGKTEWVRETLQKDPHGNFPAADKLIEVATLYGFEGWFINQETQGLNANDVQAMRDFLGYYQRKAAGKLKLIWYDAMTNEGSVAWQEELNERNLMFFQDQQQRVSDYLFLDFGWDSSQLKRSTATAKKIGRSPWQIFAGIDVQSRSYRTPVKWEALLADSKPRLTSVALYWPSSTRDIADNKTQASVYQEELKFWNGCQWRDSQGKLRRWKGFTEYFPARSVIQQLPFVTRFNYGTGDFYHENGERLSDDSWHNLSNQDLLPTWQWDTDPAKLKPSFDFSDAYHGGSSLRVDISLSRDELADLPLFKTKLKIPSNTEANIAFKKTTDHLRLFLAMTFEDGTSESVPSTSLELGKNDWRTAYFDLQAYEGKTIAKLGLNFHAAQAIKQESILLGELSVVEATPFLLPAPKVEAKPFFDGDMAEVRLQVTSNRPKDLWYYDVYSHPESKQRKWLGRTRTRNYYLPAITRPKNSKEIRLVIRPTATSGQAGRSTTVLIEWED